MPSKYRREKENIEPRTRRPVTLSLIGWLYRPVIPLSDTEKRASKGLSNVATKRKRKRKDEVHETHA
jgi:hypothetical protein